MCEVAAGREGDEFLAALDQPATHRNVAHLDSMLARVASGEPLQYVLGRWGFRHLDLMVDRRVLIPRPETETVVETALALARSMQPPIICADLGTGSGAIGLSLAAELPVDGVTVWMTDASSDAIDVARANAAGIGRAGANVRLADGDWFDALPEELRGSWRWWSRTRRTFATTTQSWNRSFAIGSPASRCSPAHDGLDAIRHIIARVAAMAPAGWLAGARDRGRAGRSCRRAARRRGLRGGRGYPRISAAMIESREARTARVDLRRTGRRPGRAMTPRRGRDRDRHPPRRAQPRTSSGAARS